MWFDSEHSRAESTPCRRSSRGGKENIEQAEEARSVADVQDRAVEEGVEFGVKVGILPGRGMCQCRRRGEEMAGKSVDSQTVLLHESEKTVQSQDGDRSAAIRAVDQPVHQPPRFGHVRQDLAMQHDEEPFTVFFLDWQSEDRQAVILERATVRDEGEEGREVFLALLRVELIDEFRFGFRLGFGRVKDPSRAIIWPLVDRFAFLRCDLIGFADRRRRTEEIVQLGLSRRHRRERFKHRDRVGNKVRR